MGDDRAADRQPLYDASSTTPTVMSFNGTAHFVVFNLTPGASDLDNITFNITPVPGLLSLSADVAELSPQFDPNVGTYTLAPVLPATLRQCV